MQIYNGRDSFYQWDTNQQVTHENLSVGDEVHVYSPMKTSALVVLAYEMDDGKVVADVPNILLQSHFPITVYRILVDDEGRSTLDEYQFQVKKRAKPTDYVYTETEVVDYRNLDRRLRALEGEGLEQAIADYLEENPIEAGATAAEAAQIEQNKQSIEKLSVDKLDSSKLPEAVNDALAQAKASGEFDGAPGKDGEKGEKGDPGEPGKDGQDGSPGKDGTDGKDYILTEADKQEIAELASELVDVPDLAEPLIGTTEEITPTQVLEALSQGRVVTIAHTDERVGTIAFNGFYTVYGIVLANGLLPTDDGGAAVTLFGVVDSAEWFLGLETLPSKDDIPTDDHINDLIDAAIDNLEIPEGGTVEMKPLTFTGAVNATYDGSEAVEVDIPDSSQNAEKVTLTSPDGSKWNLTVDNAGNVGAVKVTGGGSDEPDAPVVTTYTVTSGLTNVESTNPSAVVNEGASYTATLTVEEGYEFYSVVVIMGGVDITATAYANGVVTIASVTGNVVITASAVEVVDIEYHTMTLEDASATMTAQGKTLIRGYNNSEHSNVLVPNTLNELPVLISTIYPGTNNFNVSDNIVNIAFEENSTVTGDLEILGNSLKTIKNFPAGMTSLSTANKPPYAPNLESVSGLENNTVLTKLNMMNSTAMKYPPVLNENAPITSLNAAFCGCTAMEYDISGWSVPKAVTNIRHLFRYCSGIYGNFRVDRNYSSTNCLMALNGTSVKEVTVTDSEFAAPIRLFNESFGNYTPLNSESEINKTKQYKINVYRNSAAYRAMREAYAGIDNGIMQYDIAFIDGNAPTKNITFYGDSQLSPFGNVTSQMLPGMSDDVFLWNLAVRGASTESYKPMFAKFPERHSDVTVLWLMTNDTGIGAEATMNNIKHYVDSLETDKYIILGTWYFNYETLKARNEQLRATYGDHYLDIHQFTLDNWERITGITPTEADLSAVANDTVPPCLIHTDGVHENDAGGLVIATGIKEKLMEMGYIDNTWLATE